jgi:cysteine synthase A
MLPDTGERYLSTPLFDGISEEMSEAELALSRSTPHYRFDQAAAPTPASAAPAAVDAAAVDAAAVDAAAEQAVDQAIADSAVVMFALEWCEFCWSVRKLFAALEIPYRSIDLDSVGYQQDQLGGRIRGVLATRTGAATIPQIYVGGNHVGGCTDLFDAYREGSLQRLLNAAGVTFAEDTSLDPYALLPQWLHPRRSA